MNHQELNPKKWKELIEAKIKRDRNLTEVDIRYSCRNNYGIKIKITSCNNPQNSLMPKI